MGDEPAQEREVRRQALDHGLGERVPQPEQRLVARRPVGDQLRDHRVVGDAHLVALFDAGVDADARRQAESLDPARLGEEGLRILRVEPHLDRVPFEPCNSLLQSFAGCDPELLPDDVDAGDELGHRMLDLDSAVQLEEVEVAPVEHELDGAGAPVADRASEGDRGVAHPLSKLAVERGGGRLLEHLLVAALDRALALAEGDDLAVLVGQQLDLDVSGPLDVALVVDGVVAESRLRLPPGRFRGFLELRRLAHDTHPTAAPTGCRFHDEREADLVGLAGREHGHTGVLRDPLRLELVSSLAQGLRRRADEHEPCGLDGLREVGVLGEEAVPGMNRIGAGRLCRPDVLLGEEVVLDVDGLVREPRVKRAVVVRRGNRDGRDPRVRAGAKDPRGDLAAVRYEELSDLHRTANVISDAPASAR